MSHRVDPSALPPWRAPEPADLPQWRARLRDYTGSPEHLQILAQTINAGKASIIPTVPGIKYSVGAVACSLLAQLERRRLTEAALYYVTADMTSLALAAAATPPAEPVSLRRLPAPAGLMLFEQPIGGYRQDLRDALTDYFEPGSAPIEMSTPIVAVSWSTWTPGDIQLTGGRERLRWAHCGPDGFQYIRDDYSGVWLTFYTPSGSAFAAFPPETVVSTGPDGKPITAGQVAEATSRMPLEWDNETILAFGVPLGAAAPDTTEEWCHVVYTAFQLITQSGKAQLADVEEVPRDRAGRRRDARTGITGPTDVKIVRVHAAHRPSAAAAQEDEAASTGRAAPQWTCRWPVQPYRRNTCLNPRAHADGGCEHEEKIVPAHIKGPADKPLRVRETVNLWDSQPDDIRPA